MRVQGLDVLRGYAIVLMVIFHFSFDLNNFGYISTDMKHGLEWRYFRYVIVTMFVFLAGVSLYLANQNGIDFQKAKRRFFTLLAASLLVTIGSYTQFPKTWIYFGILHFFLVASLVGLVFLRLPILSFIVGANIILGYIFGYLSMHWLFELLHAPLHLPVRYTEDLASFVPWFGVFLLGMSFAHYEIFTQRLFNNSFVNQKHRFNDGLSFLGSHSLVVYLLHQPIFFGAFLLIGIYF
ncbi:MAG: heparan-alpha-glucosaminide N-acetyltransferase [Campylobacterota bacterium]|nr:heparan-alpha-glucosaminide N-acetyltransferase [Campylobacterota bacterium]